MASGTTCRHMEDYGTRMFNCAECFPPLQVDPNAPVYRVAPDGSLSRLDAQPHRCPVCEGRGQVAPDFYPEWPKQDTAGIVSVACRTCGGTGVLWR